MPARLNNAFTFPYTFFRQDATEVFRELKSAHLTGINLALNYHGSRDFLLRQGPQLEYLADGFHYYLPDSTKYESDSILPHGKDHLVDNKVLDGVLAAASAEGMKVNAWCVFAHNSAIGIQEPSATVTNALDNHFLSELCPSNPRVQRYFKGMVKDLLSRGVNGIAAESLNFHGARHGEHHERFFMELSPTTEFLFALCFCPSCIAKFEQRGGDGHRLKAKVALALKPFLEDSDPWLAKALSQPFLVELIGTELFDYLVSRERTVSELYADISKLTRASGAKFSYVDQSTLLDMESAKPLGLSWQVGIDNKAVRAQIDAFLPLMYRKLADDIAGIAHNYKNEIGGEIDAILRPTYPDSESSENLIEKVETLSALGISNIDFYLLDTWRPRDLQRVAAALERIA